MPEIKKYFCEKELPFSEWLTNVGQSRKTCLEIPQRWTQPIKKKKNQNQQKIGVTWKLKKTRKMTKKMQVWRPKTAKIPLTNKAQLKRMSMFDGSPC